MIYTKINNSHYQVNHTNNVLMGDIMMDNDGFFYFWPDLKGGFWEAYILLELGNKLNELNKPWEDEVNKYFDNLEENPKKSLDETWPF
jgi:hypothetical protein